jgi:hypothetical protein
MGTFQMPDFNFRLRRALNPFENQISPPQRSYSNPFDVSFDSPFSQHSSLPDLEMGQIPDYSQFYEDEGPAMLAFKSHLNKAPMPTDYAPSKWRRAGAILSGISSAIGGGDGYSAARNIIRDPYETAYEDWARSGQGLKEAATLEENTANKRMTNYQKLVDTMFDRDYKMEQLKVAWKNATNGEERNRITEMIGRLNAQNAADRNRVYGKSVDQTGRYQQGQLGLGRERLTQDQEQFESDMFHDSVQGYLDRKSREAIASRPGRVSGSDQRAAEDLALNDVITQMESDGTVNNYFRIEKDGSYTPIRSLDGKYKSMFDSKVATSYGLSGRR